jgi:hypothetical protein
MRLHGGAVSVASNEFTVFTLRFPPRPSGGSRVGNLDGVIPRHVVLQIVIVASVSRR